MILNKTRYKIKWNMKSAKKKKYINIYSKFSTIFFFLIKQSPSILYCIHKNYQRYLRQKSQRTPFDRSSNTGGNIFSRTSFQWKSTNPRRPISTPDNYPRTMYPTIGIHLGPRLPTYFDLLACRGDWAPPLSCRDIIPFCNSIFFEPSSIFF